MGNLADASAHKQGHYRKAVKKWKQHTQAKIDRIKNSNAKPAIKRARINAARQQAHASRCARDAVGGEGLVEAHHVAGGAGTVVYGKVHG